jgi:hypothetical protein
MECDRPEHIQSHRQRPPGLPCRAVRSSTGVHAVSRRAFLGWQFVLPEAYTALLSSRGFELRYGALAISFPDE